MTEMEALDELPMKVRIALKFSAARHSALEVYGFWMRGYTEDLLVELIIQKDAEMVQHG